MYAYMAYYVVMLIIQCNTCLINLQLTSVALTRHLYRIMCIIYIELVHEVLRIMTFRQFC